MRLLFALRLLGVLLTVALHAAPAVAAAVENHAPGPVFVLPVKGEINRAQFFFLRRGLKNAERAGASAVVLDLDTYGGRLDATADIQKALLNVRVPTFAFINPNAGSAGALISIATKTIYMAPVSAIGAAAPVSGQGEDIQKTMQEKVISYFGNYARSVAEKNGHNPDIAEAFMNKEKEVKIGDQIINPKGTLLTLNAQSATRRINDKPVLAAGIADNVADLVKKAGLTGAIRRLEPTGFERLAQAITMLAPLFLLGGLLGLYIEFKTPGAIMPGVFGAICFAFYFAGHYLAGLAGLEVAAFFVLGLALILGELLLAPGTIALGITGITLMIGSLIWAMVDYYPGRPVFADPSVFVRPLATFSLAAVLSIIAMAFLASFLPKTNLYRRLVLSAVSAPASVAAPRPVATAGWAALQVGQVGVARTALRLSGKAAFGDALVDVISEGAFIDAGAPVRVLAVEGARVVVAGQQGAGAGNALAGAKSVT